MAEQLTPSERSLAQVLGDYFEEAHMEATYRAQLLSSTRELVRARRRVPLAKLAWVGAAALLLAALFLALHSRPAPGGHHGITPPAPQQEQPLAAAGGQTESRHGGPHLVSTKQSPKRHAAAPTNTKSARPGRTPAPAAMREWVVVLARGPVTAAGRPLSVGARVKAGQAVRTGAGARAVLVTRRGSELALNADSQATLGLQDIVLGQGEVYCRNRRAEIKSIGTPAGRVHLLGTTLDARLQPQDRVSVTVLEGRVRLANEHGAAVVDAGRQALLVASLPPEAGAPVNVTAVTAWYDGRGSIVSDYGDIAYMVSRKDASGLLSEVWAMQADGTGKHRVKTYLGWARAAGPWLPGQQLLMANSSSMLWTHPDFQARRASTSAGHPIITDLSYVVNAATGQDARFALPAGYDPLYTDLSPDATRLAFCGSYRSDTKDWKGAQGGVWVYDLASGAMKKVLNGWIKTPVNWSADGRYLAASTGEGYGANYPLVVVDTQTGEVRDLRVQGADAHFSADGRKLAFCGDFQRSGSWSQGVPMSGRILVADLAAGEVHPISPAGEGALRPRWSPDSTKVAYYLNQDTYTDPDNGEVIPKSVLFVAATNGSGVKQVYEQPVGISEFAWAPSGDALIAVTSKGVHVIRTDGSGEYTNLGGTAGDSLLSAEAKAQTDAAVRAIQEAVFQYAIGSIKVFEGRPTDARAAFRTASDTFASLPWQYPLAALSVDQVMVYADKADEQAARSNAEMLAASGKERMSYLQVLLLQYLGKKGAFPPSLADLEHWSLQAGWGINYISNRDTAWVHMIFQCPTGGALRYTPPPAGQDPKVGDVLVACSTHPEDRVVWDEQTAQQVEWRRVSAAAQALETDPELKQLKERRDAAWEAAGVGLASWDEVLSLTQQLVEKQPYYLEGRELLGRIYTRRGQFDKALATLPDTQGGWSELTRAFCYDALGQRDKALAIYREMAPSLQGSTMGLLAERGLKEPTWPQNMPIVGLPGEERIGPTSAWKAEGSASGQGSKPEFAIDGLPNSSWKCPGKEHGQDPGEWFKLDFGAPLPVTRVLLDHNGAESIYTNDWPRGLKATATSNGTDWFPVEITQRAGFLQPAIATLPAGTSIRAIRFETTATNDPEWWTIFSVYVFGPQH